MVIDYGVCTTALIGTKKTNCNVFGLPNLIAKELIDRHAPGNIFYTKKFIEICPSMSNYMFEQKRRYALFNNSLNIDIYQLVDKPTENEQEKRVMSNGIISN